MTTEPQNVRHRPILLEMASIVLAIVLGFAVTSWDSNRRDRIRAETAVERIRLELEANLAGLAEATPYYRDIVQRLDSIVRVDGDRPLQAGPVPGWMGIRPPSIRTASFTVATSTGALEHVDFEKADQIAMAYESLDDFSTSLDQAIAAAMGGRLIRLSDWLMVLSLLGEVAESGEVRLKATVDALGPGG